MNSEDPSVRHFLVCRKVRYDLREPLAPYSLDHVVFRYRPAVRYPLVVPALGVFAHFVGTGSHEYWIEVAPLGGDEDDRPEALASYGPFPIHLGPEPAQLSRGWVVRGVPFPEPGGYAFELLLRGEIVARHEIALEE